MNCKQSNLNRIIQTLLVWSFCLWTLAAKAQVAIQFPLTLGAGTTILSKPTAINLPQYHAYKSVTPYFNADVGIALKLKDKLLFRMQYSAFSQRMSLAASFPDTKLKFNYKASYTGFGAEVMLGVKLWQQLKPFYQAWLLGGIKMGSGSFNSYSYSSRIETQYNYYYLNDNVLGRKKSFEMVCFALLFDSELKQNGMLNYGIQYNVALSSSPTLEFIQENQSNLIISGKMSSINAFIGFPMVTLLRSDGWKRVKNHAAFLR